MFDSAESVSCEAAHGRGGTDDDGDDEPLEPDPELAELACVDEVAECVVCCEVDGCALELCDGRGGVRDPVPAAAPDELSEESTRMVSTVSTNSATTEAPKPKRRRQ